MSKERRIFLGMPGYANQTGGAGEGFWRACKDDTHLIRDDGKNGSLLAANFNALWCEALNIAHNGGRLDYFAMLHNDIAPGPYWLDTLIDELEAKDLDVLGVAVPIKDGRGLTSLAIDGDNTWRVGCRLTMAELFELPETFTSDDLGGRKLLLNTGCWVCKFNMAWATTVHFEINDRIVFDRSANRYTYENESEDWFFSRQLHEIGNGDTLWLKPLKIGATRKVKISHRGQMDFMNDHIWGQKIDSETVSKSVIPNAHPLDICGWLKPEEGRKLAELANGKRVLEIGTYCGLATVCMARTAEHVTTVDYFDGRATPEPVNTFQAFKSAIERHGVADKVTAVQADDEIPGPEYDMVFIDGDHDYRAVTADIEKCRRLLKDGGLMVFHDYKEAAHPGVMHAIDELLLDGGELVETCKSLAVVKVAAAIPLEV